MDPHIVQMVVDGEPIEHFYYRSEKWIEQPFTLQSEGIKPFSGPTDGPIHKQYQEGTYRVDEAKSKQALREFVVCQHPEYHL